LTCHADQSASLMQNFLPIKAWTANIFITFALIFWINFKLL